MQQPYWQTRANWNVVGIIGITTVSDFFVITVAVTISVQRLVAIIGEGIEVVVQAIAILQISLCPFLTCGD